MADVRGSQPKKVFPAAYGLADRFDVFAVRFCKVMRVTIPSASLLAVELGCC